MTCFVPNKTELRKIESMYIRNNECINKINSYRSEDELRQYGKQYYINNIHKIKEYQQNNAEKIKIYNKNYYNKLPTIQCPCGSKLKQRNIIQHYQTKRHKNYIAFLEKQDKDDEQNPAN